MNRLVLSTLTVFALVFAGNAVASSGWTPTVAAAKVKATYTTVDQKAYDFTDAKLQKLLEAGTPETDAHVIALRAALKSQMHQAKVTRASCRGAGRAVSGRYSRFHCSVVVQGEARIPPDYVLYTASKKLTVVARPFRILAGWR